MEVYLACITHNQLNNTRDSHSNTYQLLQDFVDIIIPSGNLGWIPADEGMIGIAG